MSVHERLNLDHWISEYPLEGVVEAHRLQCQQNGFPFSDNWLPEVSVISSPIHIAIAEQLRRVILNQGHNLGPASPVDVFLWRISQNSNGPQTRIGGSPFRDPDKPWPNDSSGRPLMFLAQISFLDSKDLMPNDLPGDVLSMYGQRTGSSYIDMDSLVYEWTTADVGKKVDNYIAPAWNFCVEGVIHRTECYPSCDDSIRDLGFDVPDVLQATQIGKHPFRIQGEDPDENEIFASFSSLQPNQDWPFVNCPELPKFIHPKGHEGYLQDIFSLMFGDMGSVYFSIDKDGKYRQSWDCY